MKIVLDYNEYKNMKKQGKIIECPCCDFEGLKKHFRTNKEGQYKCPLCGYEFPKNEYYLIKEHIKKMFKMLRGMKNE